VTRVVSALAALAMAAFANAAALAQQSTQRVVGTIASIQGPDLVVKTRQGDVKVQLTENLAVSGVVRRTFADISLGAFIGVGAMPQADGSQRAVRINIFPEGQRPNEGHRPWDGAPQGTMTNAAVATSVTGSDGPVLTVKYHDGEKKIVVTPETLIVASLPGDRSELKPGANVLITQAVKKPDGTLETTRINVGRDGVVP
jgi:hypothetical protein